MFKWLRFPSLLLNIVIISVIIPNLSVLATNLLPVQNLVANTVISKNDPSLWQRIKSLFVRVGNKRTPAGEKTFCSISPNRMVSVVWSNQPLFVWQGNPIKIKVRSGGTQPGTMWEYELNENDRNKMSVFYNIDGKGKELKFGEEYYYSITYQEKTETDDIITNTLKPPIPFKVVTVEEHNKIQAELNKMKEKTPEEVAEFFGEQYFLDGVRVLFSQPGILPEKLQELRQSYCEKQ